MKLNLMLAMFNLGGWEIILILALVLILFGAKKLPGLARGLGQGIKEFKQAIGNSPEREHEAHPKGDAVPREQMEEKL
jgi:sec-independent protein translocase protein TatA